MARSFTHLACSWLIISHALTDALVYRCSMCIMFSYKFASYNALS